MLTDLVLAGAIAAAAGLMRGFAGVGSGMLMAPFYVYTFGPVETVSIIILMEIVVTAQLLPSVHSEIRWSMIAPMGAAAAASMPLGSWLLVSLDPSRVQFGVALLVTVSALVLMTGWRYQGPKPMAATISVGAVSGLLMSLTSLGNPPVMVYLLSSTDSARTNRANFTGYFAITLLVLLMIMLLAGLINWDTVSIAAFLLPIFMASVWSGARLFSRANERMYRSVALTILFFAGIYGLIRQ